MKTKLSDIIAQSISAQAPQLARNVMAHNALMNRLMAGHPKPKPLSKAQIAKMARDRKLGLKYLAKAHALGVYEDEYD